jgi:hypothetical protein
MPRYSDLLRHIQQHRCASRRCIRPTATVTRRVANETFVASPRHQRLTMIAELQLAGPIADAVNDGFIVTEDAACAHGNLRYP